MSIYYLATNAIYVHLYHQKCTTQGKHQNFLKMLEQQLNPS